MTKSDFSRIAKITQKEVENTGADIRDVQAETIIRLNRLRMATGKMVFLQKNGLTTGTHDSREHPNGLAVDCYFENVKSWDVAKTIAMMALTYGFKGIGVYWNGSMYSYHFDLGEFRGWTGTKRKGDTAWVYGILFNDPKLGAIV